MKEVSTLILPRQQDITNKNAQLWDQVRKPSKVETPNAIKAKTQLGPLMTTVVCPSLADSLGHNRRKVLNWQRKPYLEDHTKLMQMLPKFSLGSWC